jgi:hypothetical protein
MPTSSSALKLNYQMILLQLPRSDLVYSLEGLCGSDSFTLVRDILCLGEYDV